MNHLKIYKKFFNIGIDEVSLCEVCNKPASQIHHIRFKSHGGDNSLKNLAGLCVGCHVNAHAYVLEEVEIQNKHDRKIISYLNNNLYKIKEMDEKSIDYYLKQFNL